MSDLPRYPDTTGKDLTKRVDELENYIINLHRFLRFALETIDETNMTTGARGQFLEIKGLYAELYADETGLLSRMTNAEGGVSTLQQNVNGLTSTVQGVEGDLSTLTQTVDGFSLDVTNGSTSSVIKLKSGSTEISSQTISMSGLVKFTDLSTAGSTTINGGNITTGTITAVNLNGCFVDGGMISSVDNNHHGTWISGGRIETGTKGEYSVDSIASIYADYSTNTSGDFVISSWTTGTRFLISAYGGVAIGIKNTTSKFALDSSQNMTIIAKGTGLSSIITQGDFEMSCAGDLEINSENVVRISSGTNLSISAGNGHSIYIGSGSGTTQGITIGNSNSTIYLNGTVKVNGTTLPY